jgi:hypothetical protein
LPTTSEEQRRLSELAEALGDPRPAPGSDQIAEEAEVEFRTPPDPKEELQRFREEVDRMLRDRSGKGRAPGGGSEPCGARAPENASELTCQREPGVGSEP